MDVDMTNCPNYATFIQRAERVEEAERMDSNSNTSTSASVPKKNKSSKSSNGKGKSYIRNEDSPSGNGTKNCIYHGMNNTHSTDECTSEAPTLRMTRSLCKGYGFHCPN